MEVFIGGDMEEKEFNFSTKVAGSTVECPLRFWYTISPHVITPTDRGTAFTSWNIEVDNNQSELDKIKAQNGQNIRITQLGVEKYVTKVMIEVDLNPLCNEVFGGSHEALKSAMKKLDIDVWASGSGDNEGSVGHKCISSLWNNSTKTWSDNTAQSNVNSKNIIEKIYTYAKGRVNEILTQDNRIYILLSAGYPSSATIPSTLNLDYINIKLTLARTPDKLKFTDSEGNKKDYLDVNLKDEWSVLLKGVSYNWHNAPHIDKYLFWLSNNESYKEDFSFRYRNDGVGRLGIRHNNEWVITPDVYSLRSKNFECNNYLFQYKNKTYTIYQSDLEGIRKYTFRDNNDFKKGMYKFYLGGRYGLEKPFDGFIERFNFFDYAIANTDQEAEVILRGRNEIDVNNSRLNQLGKQFENPNLCPELSDFHKEGATIEEKSISKLVISNNHTKDNDHEQFAMSPRFQLLPNNRYELIVDCEVTNSCEVFVLNYHSKYGIILNAGQLGSGVNKFTFTTTNNNCPVMEQYIRLDVNNYNSKLVVNSIKLRRLD